MKKFYILLFIAISVLTSNTSYASSVLKLCTTCSSNSSFLYTAKAVVEPGISTVKTLNPYSGELKSYRVDIEPFEPGYEDRGLYLHNRVQMALCRHDRILTPQNRD